MIKFSLVFIVFLQVFLGFGQSTVDPKNYLPNIVPPSPEAFKFGSYGNTPVGLFTGSPNIEIPLFTYKTKALNIPFSLSYTSNGIKVDDVNSKVGMGWVLNEAGIITRIIRDKEDDLITDFPMNHLDFSTINRNNPIMNQYFNFFGESQETDSERDLFMFNFQGKSGKFYFDVNNNIVKFDKSDLRIEVVNTIGAPIFTFLVTTGDGVKYYFQTLEQTMLRTSGDDFSEPLLDYTSWYLTTIIHPNNEEIYFNYESDGSYYIASNSQQISKGIEFECGLWALSSTYGFLISPVYSHNIRIIGKRIKSITSNIPNYGRVDFEYEDKIPNEDTVPDTVIKSISIRDGISSDSTLKDKIELSYIVTSNQRIFLNYFHHSDISDKYSFEYITPNNLPARLSKSQDHWGYYNGEPNSTLIPKVIGHGFEYLDNYSFAIREPNSLFAKIGLLNKIVYPTKGYTDFEYEPNDYFGTKIIYPSKISQQLQVDSPEAHDGATSTSFILNNYIDQHIKINASVNFTNPPCSENLNTGAFHNTATYRVFNLTTNTYVNLLRISNGNTVIVGTSMQISSNMTSDYRSTYFHAQINNNYLIELSITRECLAAGINFSYYPSAINTLDTNIITGGMRVKSTKDYSHNSTIPITKRYFYARKSQLNISSGRKGQDPYYINYGHHLIINPVNNLECLVKDAILSSSSISSLFDTGSNNIYYKYVIVSDDDNFTNGYQENEYIINRDYRENIYLGDIDYKNIPWSNIGWDNGKLISTKIYTNKSNVFYLKKEVKNNYIKDSNNPYFLNFAIFNPVVGIFSNNLQDQCGCTSSNVNEGYPIVYCSVFHFHQKNSNGYCIASGANNVNYTIWHPCHNRNVGEILNIPSIRHMDIMVYKYITYFSYLSSTITSDYLYDSNNIQTGLLNNTITYNYNNALHLQLTSQINTNSINETIETKYFYPQDLPNEPNASSLVAKNMIGKPLKTETNKIVGSVTEKLSEQTTKYGTFPSAITGQNLLLPEYVYAGKGNNTEKKITFNSYDIKGNITQYTQESGVPVSILWGYNKTQPVAKLENIAYNSIPATLITAIQTVTDSATSTEAQVIAALNALRSSTDANMVKAMITTYTYIPLVGVRTITDPKGDTQTFSYDSFGRLQNVKDKNGNILSENEYHYRP